MSESDRKIAIVTGGSRGIGAAIAERLGREGYHVVVNHSGAHSAAEAAEVADRIGRNGGHAVALSADVSDSAQVQGMFDAVEEQLGGVDVLVNNAGAMRLATIEDSDDELFDRQIDVNLKGTFNTLREAARRLHDGGRIVNLSTSVVGTRPERYGVYAATKAAVELLTSILAKELRGRHITVNAVAPGPTATQLFLEGKPPELVDRIAKSNPFERLGTPEEIASAVAFLVGSDGGWINGQVLRANGGMV